jgi:hypothetical protein
MRNDKVKGSEQEGFAIVRRSKMEERIGSRISGCCDPVSVLGLLVLLVLSVLTPMVAGASGSGYTCEVRNVAGVGSGLVVTPEVVATAKAVPVMYAEVVVTASSGMMAEVVVRGQRPEGFVN